MVAGGGSRVYMPLSSSEQDVARACVGSRRWIDVLFGRSVVRGVYALYTARAFVSPCVNVHGAIVSMEFSIEWSETTR